MAFKAGAIYGEAILDTTRWNSGLGKMAGAIGKTIALVAIAFAVAKTKAIGAANEFQKSMSNVSTLIDTTVISTQDLTFQLLKLDPAL